jgi:hypothetical protein
MIKHFVWAVLLMISARGAFGFALLGPLPPDPGGEPWQVITIGYALPYLEESLIPGGPVFLGDIGGPHNINEEYRRVTPTLYYAYDANFLTYFGLAGTTNGDLAFGIMNSITNVSTYSTGLTEFPLNSQSFNFTAQAMFLTDLKSVTLHLLVEQLGLTEPERFTWTLHNRLAGPACPLTTEYTVVQRNFDIVDSPLNQVQYSPYVNNILYSYYITEVCSGSDTLAETVPFSADAIGSQQYTAVAANDEDNFGGLQVGGYYTGLTRDDVGGLRYLMQSNNINYESTVRAGGQLILTNTSVPQLFGPTLPFSLLFSEDLTNPPSVLETNFPGIEFIAVGTNIVNFITTNFSLFFTNQSVPPVFSNTVAHGLTNGFYFTNQPGPTTINYDPSTFIQIQTLDLAAFSDQSVTDAPAVLQALYPGLDISSVIAVPQLMFVTNFVNYLTNVTGAPFDGPPIAKTVISSITSFFGTNYIYSFGNVFTNHYYTNRTVVTQNIWITNLIGAPIGSPLIAKTNLTVTSFREPSGDFFIIPTNWCGFEVLGVSPVHILPPYGTGPTNTIVFTGFNTNGAVTNPVAGGNAFGLIQNIYDIYTNFNVVLRPGICEPVLAFSTNTFTNTINTYNYVFANIVTNHYFSNSLVTVIVTNIAPCPGGSTATLCTNITTSTFYTNLPSGDFYIVPPNLCGFSILATQSAAIVFATNTFVATNGVGVTNDGQQYSITFITSFTNYTFKVLESTCTEAPTIPQLREGAEHIQFVREDFDSLIGQFISPITNYFSVVMVTNSQAVTESYQRVITTPDVVLSAADLTPGTAANLIFSFDRTVANYDQSTVVPGLAGPGTIAPGMNLTLNKVGTVFLNGSLDVFGLTTNAFLNESTQTPLLAWGSFDGSTNEPIVYPNGQSLADLEAQIFINIAPQTVPDGTNGVPYSVTFSVAGGSPPYTISAPNINALVPGLTLPTVNNTTNAVLSGTPTTPGLFNFNLQVTDSVNRVVNLNYPITIH